MADIDEKGRTAFPQPMAMTFRDLIDAALEGSVSVQSFCSAIEHEWNFGDERAALSEVEKAPLQQLLDVVVYYSPFPHERARIPNYRSEEDVLAAAQICRGALSGNLS